MTQAQAEALIEAEKEANAYNNQLTAELEPFFRKKLENERVKFYIVDIAPFREAAKDAPYQLEAQGLWKKGFYDSVLEFLKRSK